MQWYIVVNLQLKIEKKVHFSDIHEHGRACILRPHQDNQGPHLCLPMIADFVTSNSTRFYYYRVSSLCGPLLKILLVDMFLKLLKPVTNFSFFRVTTIVSILGAAKNFTKLHSCSLMYDFILHNLYNPSCSLVREHSGARSPELPRHCASCFAEI